eukprot:366389-Chlamydomonas_euryale.AAC.2
MAARLLVVVLESRPVKRSDFAVDVMARDAGAAFARPQYDPVDSAEPVRSRNRTDGLTATALMGSQQPH